MANFSLTTAWQAFGWGVIAGMRSMSAPALASHFLSRTFSPVLAGSSLRFLQSAKVATGLKVLAATEIIGDKLPGAPNRIAAPVLTFRILSGALVGAAYHQQSFQSKWVGAVLGGIGAVAGSYGFYYLRTKLPKSTATPDLVWAQAEDALMVTGGISLANTF